MMTSIEGLHREHREIIELLDSNSMYFSEIVAEASFSKPTVVSKLEDLQRYDLIESEQVGQKKFYSTTETREDLEIYKSKIEEKAADWVDECKRQVILYERGDIRTEEFMHQTFGTLVPIFPMRILGMAYVWALEFNRQDFFDTPEGDLDRKQEELLKHAYEVCREYEIKGLEVLHVIDYDEIEVDISDCLNAPHDGILAADEIQLFDTEQGTI